MFIRTRIDDMVPICRPTFLNILGLKKDSVQEVLKLHFAQGGVVAQETNGGDRKSQNSENHRTSVHKFIESL